MPYGERISKKKLEYLLEEGYEILGTDYMGSGEYHYLLENPEGKQEHYYIRERPVKVKKYVR